MKQSFNRKSFLSTSLHLVSLGMQTVSNNLVDKIRTPIIGKAYSDYAYASKPNGGPPTHKRNRRVQIKHGFKVKCQ